MNTLWEYKKIGDVCTVERGGSPRPIDKFITEDENGINWIKIGDTTESMYITKTEQKIIPEGIKKSRYVRPGDFLLSNSMSFGRPYILQIDGCIHDGWLVLRDDSDFFDKRFLYYCLSSKTTYEKFKSMAVGGVVNNLNSEMVRNVLVPVPDRVEQCEIADLLDKLTQIISYRKNEIRLLDTLIKARFVELFGDPGTNPKGYIQMTMKDAVDAGYIDKPLDGNHGEKHPKASEYVNEGVPFIMANNIVNGVVDYDNCSKITRERADKLDKGFSHDGDVLITHKGTIGRTAIVHTKLDYIVLTPQVTYYRPLHGITAEYLKGYFDTDFFQREMKKLAEAGGSTRAYVGITNQTQLQLVIPCMDLQNQYVEFVQQADKSKFVFLI